MAHGINWRYATLAALLAFSQALGGCAGLPSQDHKMETNEQDSKFGQSMRMAASIRAGGDVSTAARFYQRAHEVDPSRPEPLLGLAELATTAGATDEAYKYYQKAISVAPDNTEMKRSYGTLLLTNGRPELALPLFQEATRLDDQDYRSFNGLGISLDLLGQQETAQQAYQNGLSSKPGSITLKNNLALSAAISGNYDKALSTLAPLAASPQAGPNIRQNLALVYALQGRIDQAVAVAAKDLTQAELQNNLAFYKLLPNLSRKDLAAIVFGIGDVPTTAPDVKTSTRTAKKKPKHKRKSRVASSRKKSTAAKSHDTSAQRRSAEISSPKKQTRAANTKRTMAGAPRHQPPDISTAVKTVSTANTTNRDKKSDTPPTQGGPAAPTITSMRHEDEASLIARTVGRLGAREAAAPQSSSSPQAPSSIETARTAAATPSVGPKETPEESSVLPFIPTETTTSRSAPPETSSQTIFGAPQEQKLLVAPSTGLAPSTTLSARENDAVVRARLSPDFPTGPVSDRDPSASSHSVDTRIGLGFIEPKTFNDPLSRLNSGTGGLLLLELEQRASGKPTSRPGDTETRNTTKSLVKSETFTSTTSETVREKLNRDQEPAEARMMAPPSDETPPSASTLNGSSPPLGPSSSDPTDEMDAGQEASSDDFQPTKDRPESTSTTDET